MIEEGKSELVFVAGSTTPFDAAEIARETLEELSRALTVH
jgi:hypothetical protein